MAHFEGPAAPPFTPLSRDWLSRPPARVWHRRNRPPPAQLGWRPVGGGFASGLVPADSPVLGEGVIDRVQQAGRFLVPFGLLGDLVEPLLVRPRLRAIFDYRAAAIGRILPDRGATPRSGASTITSNVANESTPRPARR